MTRLLSLDSGHLTDEELGINPHFQRAMQEVPQSVFEAVRRPKRPGFTCTTCHKPLRECACVV